MRVIMKYVAAIKRKGRVYHYYRRDGRLHGRLRGAPGSTAFLSDYARIHDTYHGSRGEDAENSFADICTRYMSSPEFRGLSDATKKSYMQMIEGLRRMFGPAQVSQITRAHVKAYRETLSGTPAKANISMSVMRVVMEWAVDAEIIAVNPATKIKAFKGGSHDPWPEAVIARVLENAPAHLAHAIALALYTGQRKGDLLKLRWSDVQDGWLVFTQQKTGAKIEVPLHPQLRALLATIPKSAVTVLTTNKGRVWTPSNFDGVFKRSMGALDAQGWVFHGLRANAASRLRDAGCSDAEIASITGHKSMAMVQHYTRGADQRRLAEAAMAKLTMNKST